MLAQVVALSLLPRTPVPRQSLRPLHVVMSALTADDDLPIVIAGAGLHGAALAYYLTRRGEKPLLVDRHSVAAAASGKGGGFLARDWGSGPTEQLHTTSFALHQELAESLGVQSYRSPPFD